MRPEGSIVAWPRRAVINVGVRQEAVIEVDIWPTTSWHVGWAVCWECGGDGDWTKFHPEPESLPGPLACVECKGTGRRHVSI